jgi:phosphate transport system protein
MSEEEPIPEPPQVEHRLAYHREMEDLTNGVVRLGAMACETIPWGTDAVLSGDLGETQKVIDGDDEIDELSYELEERCVSIIARQAPMAGELRRLVTIVKLIGEIERSADLMVNVCKSSRRLYGATLSPHFRGLLAAMGKEANKLLRLSIDAFADGNVSLAMALGDIDDELDQLNRDMIESIFEANVGGELDLGPAVQLALIARYYERIGDHAVNIGERVVYMVTGRSLEHAYMHRSDDAAAGHTAPTGGGPKLESIDRDESEE